MNRGLWISRKNHLLCLIKKASELCGGDGIDFLNEHCAQIIESHADEKIEVAIDCYAKMVEELQKYSRSKS